MLKQIYFICTITLVISQTINGLSKIESCTNATESCPLTKEDWIQRSKVFNCTPLNYSCIRTSSNTLVECCIPAYDIDAGTGRCPEVNYCDNIYKHPVLNVKKRFKECPEEIYGCPSKDHATFTVNELYKYPACLVKEFSDLRKPETTSRNGSTEGLTKLTTTNVVHAESTTKSNTSTKFKTSTQKLVTSLHKMVTTSLPKKDEASHFNHTNPWHVVLFLLNIIIIIALLLLCRRVPGKQFFPCSTCKSDDVEEFFCCNDKAENRKIERLKGIVLTVTNRLSRAFQLSPLQTYSKLKLLDSIVPPILRHDERFCNTYIKIENEGTENEGIEEERNANSKPEYKNFELQNPHDIFYQNGERLRRIFLVGETGSGKTTFCHWLLQLWCNSRQYCLSGERKCKRNSLKDFDFVFFVPLEKTDDTNFTLEDIICDEVLKEDCYLRNDLKEVLSSDKYRCLILIDGVGEWNIDKSVTQKSNYDGIPNLRGLSNSTIIFTSRPSKFQAVSNMVRDSDAVFRILGLDKNGAKSFADKIGHHLSLKINAKEYDEILHLIEENEMQMEVSVTFNPLLVSTIIHIMSQAETNEETFTFHLVKFIGLLIEVAEQKHGHRNEPNTQITDSLGLDLPVQENYHFFKNIDLMQKLGETALSRRESPDYQSDTLASSLGLTESELGFALNVGLISREERKSVLTRKVKIRFLNSCIQNLLAAVYLIGEKERFFNGELIMNSSKIERSSIFDFATGLQKCLTEEITHKFRQTKDSVPGNESIQEAEIETSSQNSFSSPGSTKMEGNGTEDELQNYDNCSMVGGNEVSEHEINNTVASKQIAFNDLHLIQDIPDDLQNLEEANGCNTEFDHMAQFERFRKSSIGKQEWTDMDGSEVKNKIPMVDNVLMECNSDVSIVDDIQDTSSSSSPSTHSLSGMDYETDRDDAGVCCIQGNVQIREGHQIDKQLKDVDVDVDSASSSNLRGPIFHHTFQDLPIAVSSF